MKPIREILSNLTRKGRPAAFQMELPLAGSRLTREETNFLAELRALRERLAART